jgi:two-component system, NtrC family, sensor kinase
MSAMHNSTVADPEQRIADLELQLAECKVERDEALQREAVIAIENARLLTETREALQQQTATAEVLQVINVSPGDLAPVFDAVLDKATRLCEGDFGILWRFGNDSVWPEALYRVPPAFAEFWREPIRPGPETGTGRMLKGEGTFAVADAMKLPAYHAGEPQVRAIVDLAGARSMMIAPLRKGGTTLGAITTSARRCVRLQINRSRYWKTSRRRRSSRWRTRG